MLSGELLSDPDLNSKHLHSTTSWRAALRPSWLGQMIASVCWIVSVFAYGVSSVGDAMQLVAALAWMIANLAALWELSA